MQREYCQPRESTEVGAVPSELSVRRCLSVLPTPADRLDELLDALAGRVTQAGDTKMVECRSGSSSSK